MLPHGWLVAGEEREKTIPEKLQKKGVGAKEGCR